MAHRIAANCVRRRASRSATWPCWCAIPRCSAEFTAAFDEAGIPYVVNRGKGFYETPRSERPDAPAAGDRQSAGRDQPGGGAALAAGGGVGRGAAAARRCSATTRAARWRAGTEAAAAFDAEDHRAARAVSASGCASGACGASTSRFDRLLLEAMDDCGYRRESASAARPTWTSSWRRRASRVARMSLDEFVEELALVRASNPREPDAPPEDAADAVKVMTVHSAKGLEFPVVFVAALHKGVETNPPVVAFSRQYGLGARWRNPADRRGQGRPVPARHPRGAQAARAGGEPPPALCRHDARRGAPGA